MRALIDSLVLALLILMVWLVYMAWQVQLEWALYLLLVYSCIWAVIIIAVRATIHGNQLRRKVTQFKAKGKEYHRFSRAIMLLAFGPAMAVLMLLAIRLATTLR